MLNKPSINVFDKVFWYNCVWASCFGFDRLGDVYDIAVGEIISEISNFFISVEIFVLVVILWGHYQPLRFVNTGARG